MYTVGDRYQVRRNREIVNMYLYAKDVLNKRWLDAEPHIICSPKWSYYYAKHVIRGRWVEAECSILKSHKWAYHYIKFIDGVEPSYESHLS